MLHRAQTVWACVPPVPARFRHHLVPETDDIDALDMKQALEELADNCTCEVCGDMLRAGVRRVWHCHVEKKAGYTSKHWRHRRVCWVCLNNIGRFDKFVFPVIGESENSVESLTEIFARAEDQFGAGVRVEVEDATAVDANVIQMNVRLSVPVEAVHVNFTVSENGAVLFENPAAGAA